MATLAKYRKAAVAVIAVVVAVISKLAGVDSSTWLMVNSIATFVGVLVVPNAQ